MADRNRKEANVVDRLSLDLTLEGEPGRQTRRIAESLSGVDRLGDCLFLGSDEGPGLERLQAVGKGTYGNRSEFLLGPLFSLPGEEDVEADIESVSIHKDWLWLATSHAVTRPRLEDDVEAFAEVGFHPRRYVLGRVPLAPDEDGLPQPVQRDGPRRAQCLALSATGSVLTDALARDPHLCRALAIPAKENGFDIEGIAARNERVILGLRGPVLRARAMLLDIDWSRTTGDHKGLLALPDGIPYRKLFLDLDGLGVRDLCRRGKDLVILAGPTMPLPAPFRLFVIPELFEDGAETDVIRPEYLFDVPVRDGHPEGITLYDSDPATFLVVVDGAEPEKKACAPALLLQAP
jgi:hypothetical protein